MPVIHVRLTDTVLDDLKERAQSESRTASNLAAYFIKQGLEAVGTPAHLPGTERKKRDRWDHPIGADPDAVDDEPVVDVEHQDEDPMEGFRRQARKQAGR